MPRKNPTGLSGLMLFSLLGIPMPYLLNDRGIRRAVSRGHMTMDVSDEQIQPASIDLRIGSARVYDDEARERFNNHIASLSPEEAMKEQDSDDMMLDYARETPDSEGHRIIVPPRACIEAFLHDKVSFDMKRYSLSIDLKSTMGRLGMRLNTRVILHDKEGDYIQALNFNPNALVLYSHSRFAQLFIHPRRKNHSNGYIVTDSGEAEETASKICKSDYAMLDNFIIFTLGASVFTYKSIGEIDTARKYSEDELYDIHDTNRLFIQQPGDMIIAHLRPRLELPADVGVKLISEIPSDYRPLFQGQPMFFSLDSQVTNAGWVDPGYKGSVTAQSVRAFARGRLSRGEPVALGLICKYKEPADNPYGSAALGSHYQGSEQAGVRN